MYPSPNTTRSEHMVAETVREFHSGKGSAVNLASSTFVRDKKLLYEFTGLYHHSPHIFKEVGRMRIVLSIAIFVVHAVHYAVGTGNQVRGTLEEPNAEIEYTLQPPCWRYTFGEKHIGVRRKCERTMKRTNAPKKDQDRCHYKSLVVSSPSIVKSRLPNLLEKADIKGQR